MTLSRFATFVGYARAENDWELEKESYHVLYPQLAQQSTAIGGTFVGSIWWGAPALGLGGAAIGHFAGHTMAKREGAKHEDETNPSEDAPDSQVEQANHEEEELQTPSDESLQLIRLPPAVMLCRLAT